MSYELRRKQSVFLFSCCSLKFSLTGKFDFATQQFNFYLLMKKLLAFGLMALAFCTLSAQEDYTSFFTGSLMDATTTPIGGVCLMGGATENDNAMRWFLERADGGDILVIRASGSDGYNDYMFSDLGVTVNSVESIVFNNAQAATDPYVLDRIAKAEAIWIAGGNQYNYVSFWRNTAVANLINTAITERNIVIGGTSAGMAILGGVYFTAQNGTVTSTTALANPYDNKVAISNAPFIRVPYLTQVITDTHYDNPDRRGRHTVFLARAIVDYNTPYYGIACDEYTAVCIDESGIASVYGTYPDFDDNAYFITPNCEVMNNLPENCASNQPLSWSQDGQALKVYAVKGTPTGLYTFDLNTWIDGDGGEWQDWSTDAGSFAAIEGNAPVCNPVNTTIVNPNLSFEVFPNPNNGRVRIQLNSSNRTEGNIQLLDASGKLLQSWPVVGSTDNLDLSTLSSGVYWLEYVNGEDRAVRQIVVR